MTFFHATAMAGRLHILDVGDFGSWQPDRIAYWDEETLDSIADRMIFRKAMTVEELDAALESSRGEPGDPGPLASVTVWISEDLLDAARDRWEEMREHNAVTNG